MKKILTVSLFAMMAVSAANADIASTDYVGRQITATAGKLTDLATTAQGNLVAAINEVKASIGTVSGDNGQLSSDLEQTRGDLEDLTGRVNTAETNITSLQSNKANTEYVNTELDKKQNNLSADQLTAVNSGITSAGVAQITTNKTAIDTINKGAVMTSGITSAGVTQITTNKNAITTLNANDQTEGSVAYQVKALADGAVATNTASINTINNSAVMKSGVTAKVVESVGTHTTDINTIKASDVMKSGVTAAVVAKANSAMQEANLKALESWTTGQCAEPTVTCSLISKGGKIAWEVVTY